MNTLPSNASAPGGSGIPPWALALAAMMLLMFGFNGYMIWLSSHDRRDLVRADYYDAGLDEDRTMARNALARAAGRVELRMQPEGWEVEAGADLSGSAICRAHFYRPDDGREDRVLVLTRSEGDARGRALWKGPRIDFRRGLWIVNLVWEDNGSPRSEATVRYAAH